MGVYIIFLYKVTGFDSTTVFVPTVGLPRQKIPGGNLFIFFNIIRN